MACDPISDPLGCIPTPGNIVNGGVEALAKAIDNAVASVIKTMLTWWLDLPSIDLNGEGGVVHTIRGYLLPIAVAVAVAGIIWQGARMAVRRKPDGLIDIARGMWSVALWSAIGITGPAMALRAGDVFSVWVLNSADGAAFGKRLSAALTVAYVSNPGLTIILGIVVILASIVQTFLLMFREASIIILSSVIVLAAAGQFSPATKPWLKKILSWGVALIAWKPAAALVYKVGFVMIGSGRDPRTQFMGLSVLLLAIIAMPVLMKFFTWAAGAIDSSGGGMAMALAAGGGAMNAASWLGGSPGGSSASDHAKFLQQAMGPGGSKPSGSTPGPAAKPGGQPGPQPPAAGKPPAPAAAKPPTPAASAPAANAGMKAGAGKAAAGLGPVGAAVAVGQTLATGAKTAANTAGKAGTEGGDKK